MQNFIFIFKPIDIHFSKFNVNLNSIFKYKKVECDGICFLKRDPIYVKMLTCAREMVRVPVTTTKKILKIKVQPYDNSVWQYNSSVQNFELHNSLQIAHNNIQYIKNKTITTHNKIESIEQEIAQIGWLRLAGYIMAGILTLGVLSVICYFVRIIVSNIQKCRAKKTVAIQNTGK